MAAVQPTRGDIWRVDLSPTRGSETRKIRPAVVISATVFDHLPVRIVVPLTSWQAKFANQLNKVLVPHTSQNGLANDSAADFLQVRCVALERFLHKLGTLEASVLDEIVAGVTIAVDYQP
jgi:mRNA interferase MazF